MQGRARRRRPRATSTSASSALTGPIWLARPDRPVEGPRLAVKDLFDTAGLTTTYGSAIFRDHVPDRTATAVELLETAGWSNAGKTNLHEFAYGITSQNPHFGDVPNPLVPGRIAGGSSGGSAAALAAGEADAALGTDTGGSIRIPAACCGVAGFKPSFGLVPTDGVYPLAPSFDHAGPMARDVATCAELMDAMAPEMERATLGSLAELRIGVAWAEQAEPAIGDRVRAAAMQFGDRRDIELGSPEPIGPAFMREVAETHADLFAEHGELYGPNVATKVKRCLEVTDEAYEDAKRERERCRERLAAVFDDVDLVLTPTLACAPHLAGIDELEIRALYVRFTLPFNATGAPALAVPCGPGAEGLPASAQLVGPPGADALVLAAGELLEATLRAR
jgi:aspartyl-tRNA(Asn)/glutamyl-tRNA(Gln) amidotransferase subunit A